MSQNLSATEPENGVRFSMSATRGGVIAARVRRARSRYSHNRHRRSRRTYSRRSTKRLFAWYFVFFVSESGAGLRPRRCRPASATTTASLTYTTTVPQHLAFHSSNGSAAGFRGTTNRWVTQAHHGLVEGHVPDRRRYFSTLASTEHRVSRRARSRRWRRWCSSS